MRLRTRPSVYVYVRSCPHCACPQLYAEIEASLTCEYKPTWTTAMSVWRGPDKINMLNYSTYVRTTHIHARGTSIVVWMPFNEPRNSVLIRVKEEQTAHHLVWHETIRHQESRTVHYEFSSSCPEKTAHRGCCKTEDNRTVCNENQTATSIRTEYEQNVAAITTYIHLKNINAP